MTKKVDEALELLKKLDLAEGKITGKYTKKLANKILLLIRMGVFFRDAFYAMGLDEITMARWAQEYPEFMQQVFKFRYQALADVQKQLWITATEGNVIAIEIFLKTSDPKRWNIRPAALDNKDDYVERILFVDRILEIKNKQIEGQVE